MQYYIGSAKFIGLEISSNIGYQNIGKMSYRCNANLHHMQEKLEFAASIPVQIARNFISSPKKYCRLYLIPLTIMDFRLFTSSIISSSASERLS